VILPTHLSVRGGHLWIGDYDTVDLAERFGTPLYVTDEERVRENFRRLEGALTAHYGKVQVLYAAKANGNLAIFRILAGLGAGADVFSAGELALALQAGMRPEALLFNGSSKSPSDLALAVETDVKVSVDSLDELRQLNEAAADAGKTVDIAFRINPAINVPTHPKIATGLATSKFGIPAGQILDAYREALSAGNINPVGMHCHIGSQILALEPFAREAEVLVDVAADLVDMGVNLSFIDIGGGLGIPYHRGTDRAPTPEEYAAAIMPVFLAGIKDLGIEPALWVEPGRYLVADSTLLLARVNSVKTTHKTFANVDAGFNLLIRPAMYDSYHEVVAANKADSPPAQEYTIAGPICETGDILAKDRQLPNLAAGDLVAVLDAGAYGFAMSSQYNSRPRCPEVILSGERADLMRRAETVRDLTAPMVTPSWQERRR
jgi:diaminopimelate decarboxylase